MSGYPFSQCSRPETTDGLNDLRQMKKALKKEVQSARASRVFAAARTHQPALANHETPLSALAVLSDESQERYPEKEALTRALLDEYQLQGEPLWSSLLLVAYYPALSRLRGRLKSDALCPRDLDHLVIEKFLEVAGVFPLSFLRKRTCMHLRQQTARSVFQALKEISEERSLIDSVDDVALARLRPSCWPEPSPKSPIRLHPHDVRLATEQLLKLAGNDIQRGKLRVIIATKLRGEKLRSYVARRHAGASESEMNRAYERLKRERTRTLQRLRRLLDDLVVPD